MATKTQKLTPAKKRSEMISELKKIHKSYVAKRDYISASQIMLSIDVVNDYYLSIKK